MKRFSSNKMRVILTLCICTAMFVCTAASNPPQRSNKILEYAPNLGTQGGTQAFEDNTLLFYRGAQGVIPRMDFYSYNVETGKESRVTSLYNGWMHSRLYTVMDQKVYFYLGMRDKTVTLVEMDVEKKSCRFLEEGLEISPLTASAHALSDKILLYKSSYDGERQTGTAVVDIFDPKQDRIINAVTKTFQNKDGVRTGEAIRLCASFPEDKSLWRKQQPEGDFVALVESFDGEKQGQLTLRLYLENGEVVKEYNANLLIPFYEKTSIYNMRYLGNGYFYFESFNRDGWICRMEEDSLVFVGPEKWDDFSLSVELAATGKNLIQRYYVLYRFGKGEYLCVFDTQNGRFYSVPIQQADKKSGFVFDFPYVDENYNIVMLYSKEADPPAREPNGAIKLLEHYEWTNLEEMLPYATPLDW